MEICKFFAVVFAAAALVSGCTHERHLVGGARHPEIEVTEAGAVLFRSRVVEAEDLPDLLDDCGFDKKETVNILIPPDLKNYAVPRRVMAVLAQNGYRRPVLVGKRQAYSEVVPQKKAAAAPGRRSVRYK